MKHWSPHWKGSVKPRKQRSYRRTAPLHVKRAFVSAHLAKALGEKYGRRSLRIRTGDKVVIMRGQFKKRAGAVTEVDVKNERVFISGIELVKKDGSKARYPVHPSAVQITELESADKRRLPAMKRYLAEEKKT